jgi:phosphatidylglycerol:prolipoprotein diacylglycerol transferase
VYPTLFTVGAIPIQSYAIFVLLAFVVAWRIRKAELARLGHRTWPGYHWVLVGALLGAVVGAKLGMFMFEPTLRIDQMLSLDFTGKTVVGGLIGGYLGVELAKKRVGITQSTGDAFAVAVPLAQAVGRVGCLLNGCCYGTAFSGVWSMKLDEVSRHPTQIYESILLLLLAAWLWSIRLRPAPAGHLFRRYLVGYALIRFSLEFLRGDPSFHWGPLSIVQLVCLAAALLFGTLIIRGERTRAPSEGGSTPPGPVTR